MEGILMEGRYLRQSELVVRCIPSIAEESCFAIKGGTAINLFELDLPRLSVDIDLTFLPVSGRDTAIREINAALDRIAERLRARGFLVRMHGTDASRKMTCFANGAEIKVEPNFILRGTVYPTRQLELAPKMSEIVGASAEMAVLSREELYGGKFCAALDHNRPLHEMLAPNMLDQSETFASQFAGMSDVPFEYDEHVATFRRLVADINDSLTREDRERLVAFTALEVDADVFGIPGLEKLPAVIWKRMNLETLRQRDARKFADNALALERILL